MVEDLLLQLGHGWIVSEHVVTHLHRGEHRVFIAEQDRGRPRIRARRDPFRGSSASGRSCLGVQLRDLMEGGQGRGCFADRIRQLLGRMFLPLPKNREALHRVT